MTEPENLIAPAPPIPAKPHKWLTTDEIRNGCITLTHGDKKEQRICTINEEFRQGFDFINEYKKSVSVFGSARFAEGSEYYEIARTLGARVVSDLGYAIITGGGPGIMEAANRGAYEKGGASLGLTIDLPQEQDTNKYVTATIPFNFFFARKVALSYAAEAYVFFPGGFGTLDEFFEIMTLVQTGKIKRIPIFLVGVDFWKPLVGFIRENLDARFHTINPEDNELYTMTDDLDLVMKKIKDAGVVKGF